jgi:hypothetical protein
LDAIEQIGGMVWCPSTNRFLLGKTANITLWDSRLAYVMLGSDSRLTADGDLLDELHAAMSTELFQHERTLIEIIQANPAQKLDRLQQIGHLEPSAFADWIAYSSDKYLVGLCRADLALVVKGGVPQIGDPEVMAKFPHIPTVRAILDGRSKAIHIDLAKRILKCQLKEPGLEVDVPPKRRLLVPGLPNIGR